MPANTMLSIPLSIFCNMKYRPEEVAVRADPRPGDFDDSAGVIHHDARPIRGALESGSRSNLNIVRRWLLEIKRHCLRVNSS